MENLNIKTAQINFFVEDMMFIVEKFDESQNLVDKTACSCYTIAEQEYHNWCGK